MDLKNYKRVSSGSEFRDVVQTSDTEPRFRSNGHQLEFNPSNGDDISTVNDPTFNASQLQDVDIEFNFYNDSSLFGGIFAFANSNATSYITLQKNSSFGDRLVVRFEGTDNNVTFPIGSNDLGDGWINFKFNNLKFFINDVETQTTVNRTFTNNLDRIIFGRAVFVSQRLSTKLGFIKVQGESFNPVNINANAQIEGSNGTIAQVNSSAADPINYILGTVFQKRGFALVGNGSTQKIVSPLGGEIVLTSTPLEGGFDLDGKTYNLTEGLGNVIKSTDGTTESDIIGFSGTSLNFGGWLKGDNINGWNPYTV